METAGIAPEETFRRGHARRRGPMPPRPTRGQRPGRGARTTRRTRPRRLYDLALTFQERSQQSEAELLEQFEVGGRPVRRQAGRSADRRRRRRAPDPRGQRHVQGRGRARGGRRGVARRSTVARGQSSSSTTRPTSSATLPRPSPRHSRRRAAEPDEEEADEDATRMTAGDEADDAGRRRGRPQRRRCARTRPIGGSRRMRLVAAELVDSREILPGQWLQSFHAPALAVGLAGRTVRPRPDRRPLRPRPAPAVLVQHGRPGERRSSRSTTGSSAGARTGSPGSGPATRVDMLGPLGRPFEVDPRSRHLLLVAGGLGMAGVRMLADEAIRDGRAGDAPVRGRAGAPRSIRRACCLTRSSTSSRPTTARWATGASSRSSCRSTRRWADQAFACGPVSDARAPSRTWPPAVGSGWASPASARKRGGGGLGPPSGSPAAPAQGVPPGVDGAEHGLRRRRLPGLRCDGQPGMPRAPQRGVCREGRRGRARVGPSSTGSRAGDRPTYRPRRPVDRAAPRAAPRHTRSRASLNPILVASGTFGYGVEYSDVVDIQRLGAICCKGTTLRPRVGNITPRVTETPAGMLNSIGLQNPGVDAVVRSTDRPGPAGTCRSSSTSPASRSRTTSRWPAGLTACPASPASS